MVCNAHIYQLGLCALEFQCCYLNGVIGISGLIPCFVFFRQSTIFPNFQNSLVQRELSSLFLWKVSCFTTNQHMHFLNISSGVWWNRISEYSPSLLRHSKLRSSKFCSKWWNCWWSFKCLTIPGDIAQAELNITEAVWRETSQTREDITDQPCQTGLVIWFNFYVTWSLFWYVI